MWVASDHLVSSAVSATKSALPYLGPERLQWVSVTTLQSSISGQSPIKAADSRVHPPPSGPAFMVLICVCVCVCVCVSHSVVSDCLRFHGLSPTRLLCPWDFPGKNTGVGCHFLLQGSSQPVDRTPVSCTAGRNFTI